jgi:hypothetical protein
MGENIAIILKGIEANLNSVNDKTPSKSNPVTPATTKLPPETPAARSREKKGKKQAKWRTP